MNPGLYEAMTMATYLSDPAPSPSLSASIIHLLVNASPRHAWAAHPRLGNCAPRDDNPRSDLGTAAHAFLLEGINACEVLPPEFRDWRKKEAQAIRDATREAGRVPMLSHKWDEVLRMTTAAQQQLELLEPPIMLSLERGRAEESLFWIEPGDPPVWCKARLDWLGYDHTTILDYKSTEGTANPEILSRTLWQRGWDIKAAWYLRGVRTVLGTERPTFTFLVQEAYQPYALSALGLSPAALAIADSKIARAVATWRVCLREGVWPGYPMETVFAEPPPWEAAREEATLYREQTRDSGGPIEDELWPDGTRP